MTPCPKCGNKGGWTGPAYSKEFLPSLGSREWLAFGCRDCGYMRREPTKDAKPAEEVVYVIMEDSTPFISRWWRRLTELL